MSSLTSASMVAVVALGASLRWLLTEPRPREKADDDYGLLRAVATVDDLDTGESIRALLVAGKVRATVATGVDGRVRVLVFTSEYARARRLVSWVL